MESGLEADIERVASIVSGEEAIIVTFTSTNGEMEETVEVPGPNSSPYNLFFTTSPNYRCSKKIWCIRLCVVVFRAAEKILLAGTMPGKPTMYKSSLGMTL